MYICNVKQVEQACSNGHNECICRLKAELYRQNFQLRAAPTKLDFLFCSSAIL